MPAIILIRGQDNYNTNSTPHSDLPDAILSDQYLKGYITSTRADSLLGGSECPPFFASVRITDADINLAEIEYLRKEWSREISAEVVSVISPTEQRFHATVDPMTTSNVSNRGSAAIDEINALLSTSTTPATVQSIADNEVIFDMEVVDSLDRDEKLNTMRKRAKKNICRRQYRVSDEFTDATMDFNSTNNNAPMAMSWMDFQLQIIDRRDEI